MKTAFYLISLIILFASCEENPNNDLIQGKWNGTSWVKNGNASKLNSGEVQFQFNEDHSYWASYGKDKESGDFRIAGDKLYTKAENQVEKMVKIARVTTDSLWFEMNRAGNPETLILVR